MTLDQRKRYEQLSALITDAMSQLKGLRDPGTDGDFFSWARSVASRNQGETGAIAMRFVSDTSKRRARLNHLDARYDAVMRLIRREFAVNPDARIILFHESISDVMDFFGSLWQNGFSAIAEHSELPNSTREAGLELFRRGLARIIVSARSLIEGFNVPAVDVGISSSPHPVLYVSACKASACFVVTAAGAVKRKRLASMCCTRPIPSKRRFMRRWTGTRRPAPTVTSSIAGATLNRSRCQWRAPAKRPLPNESQIDESSLEEGCNYPGQYEGIELTCDSQRNIRNGAGEYAEDTAELAEAILRIKGSGGKFRVTPRKHFALVRLPVQDDWQTLFVKRLKRPLRASTHDVAVRPLTKCERGRAALAISIRSRASRPWRRDFDTSRSQEA